MIAIVTPIYGRTALTSAFYANVARLRNASDVDLMPIAVVSTVDDRRLAERAGWHVVINSNEPLSDKANAGCAYARTCDVDGVLKLDSDDFPSARWLAAYLRCVTPRPGYSYAACATAYYVRELTVYDRETGRCATKRFNRIGSCRYVDLAALDAIDWQLYAEGLNSRLDRSMDDRLKAAGVVRIPVDVEEGVLITVKNGRNIWSYDDLIMGKRTDHTGDVARAMWRTHYPRQVAEYMLEGA